MQVSDATTYRPLVGADWPLRDWLHAEPLVRSPKDGSLLALIPEGDFITGGENYRRAKSKACLPAFYMALHPVTNAQYKIFVDATGHRPPRSESGGYRAWRKKKYPQEIADDPVVLVSWEDAQAYCEWAGLRLPTPSEWQKGARGTDGREYPWGDDWESGRRCRHGQSKGNGTTCGVWSYPEGCSPWGLYQMSGNVWEWCGHESNVYVGLLAFSSGGGSWAKDNPRSFRCAFRDIGGPGVRAPTASAAASGSVWPGLLHHESLSLYPFLFRADG